VKTVSDKVVRHSLAYLSVRKSLAGDVSLYLKIVANTDPPPLHNADFQSIFDRSASAVIGNCIRSFDWYRHRWPWMTLQRNSLYFALFYRIRQFCRPITVTSPWLKIDVYFLQNIIFHFWPKLTHPAARSVCDSWATCLFTLLSCFRVRFKFAFEHTLTCCIISSYIGWWTCRVWKARRVRPVTAVKFVSKVRRDSVASVENRVRLDHRDCKACRE